MKARAVLCYSAWLGWWLGLPGCGTVETTVGVVDAGGACVPSAVPEATELPFAHPLAEELPEILNVGGVRYVRTLLSTMDAVEGFSIDDRGTYPVSDSEFSATAATFANGMLRMTVREKENGDGELAEKPLLGAAIRALDETAHSLVVVRLRARLVPGTTVGFFSAKLRDDGRWNGPIIELQGTGPSIRLIYENGPNGTSIEPLDASLDLGSSFHVFAYEIGSARVSFFVDGAHAHSFTTEEHGITLTPPWRVVMTHWAYRDEVDPLVLPTSVEIDYLARYDVDCSDRR